MKVSSYRALLLALLTCLSCGKHAIGKSTMKAALSRPPQRLAAKTTFVPSATVDRVRHTAPSSPAPETKAAKGKSNSYCTGNSSSICAKTNVSNIPAPHRNVTALPNSTRTSHATTGSSTNASNTTGTRSNSTTGNRGKRKRIPTNSQSNATLLEEGDSRSSNNTTSRSTGVGSGTVPAPRPNATSPEGLRPSDSNPTTNSTAGIGSNGGSSTNSKWSVPAPPLNMTEPEKDRTGSNQTANNTGGTSSTSNKSARPAASLNVTVPRGSGTSDNGNGNFTNGSNSANSKSTTPASRSNVTVISSNGSGTGSKGSVAPASNMTDPKKLPTGSNHTTSNRADVTESNSTNSNQAARSNVTVTKGPSDSNDNSNHTMSNATGFVSNSTSSSNSTRPAPRTNVTVPEGLQNSTTNATTNATGLHPNRTSSSDSGRIPPPHSTFGPGSYHNGINSTSTPSDRIDVQEPVVIFQSNLDRVPIMLKVVVPNMKQNQKNRSGQLPDRRLWRLWGREKSEVPSAFPSMLPSRSPSLSPTRLPSLLPSTLPSALPTTSPSASPSTLPSALASESPSITPSTSPSSLPSLAPTPRLEHHWGIQILALPRHGTLYASSHSNETMVLNAVYPIPWSSAYDSDDDMVVFPVEYALNDTLYFNTPHVDAYGQDLPFASSSENITFCVVAWTTLASSSNEQLVHDNYTVVDDSITVLPIAVVHVNHGLPVVTVSDQELVVTASNHSPIQILPKMQVADHELDFNMNRVRVDVWTAQGAQLSLNDKYRHLADFDSCRQRRLAAAPQAAVWQCIGEGFMNTKLTFLAIPDDVSLILSFMRYLTPPPPPPFYDYSNSHDSVFIRLYDGVDGDCLTEAEHVAYMVAQNHKQARPEAPNGWNHTANATTTAYFGQCLMKEVVIKIRWNVTNPYGDDDDDSVVSRHSQTNSNNASSNSRNFGDSWWEIVLGLTLLVLQFVAFAICLCCCCEMLPLWLLSRQSKVATTTATTSAAPPTDNMDNDLPSDDNASLALSSREQDKDESINDQCTANSPHTAGRDEAV